MQSQFESETSELGEVCGQSFSSALTLFPDCPSQRVPPAVPAASSQPGAVQGVLWGQILHRVTASHPTILPSPSAAEPRSWSPRSEDCPSRQGCFPPSFHLTGGREKTKSPGWMAPRRGLLPREAWQGGKGCPPPAPGSQGTSRTQQRSLRWGEKLQLGSGLSPPWLSSSGAAGTLGTRGRAVPGGSAGS